LALALVLIILTIALLPAGQIIHNVLHHEKVCNYSILYSGSMADSSKWPGCDADGEFSSRCDGKNYVL